jgi:hypothetical protein
MVWFVVLFCKDTPNVFVQEFVGVNFLDIRVISQLDHTWADEFKKLCADCPTI